MKGTKDAFESAMCRALLNLRGRASRLTRNPTDADDLMQATALQALVFRDSYVESGNMAGWLATVMHTVHLNRVRWLKSRPAYMGGDLPDCPVQPTAELVVAVAEVGAALHRLTAEHRSVLIRDAAGYSYEEIAAVEGIPLGTLKSRLNRARQALSRQGDFI